MGKIHTHYDKSNLNPFFHKILSKPIPQWILATETAMIQIYHTVYKNTKKNNSLAYFNKTNNNPRPLDIGTFVLKRNFLHVHFSDKLKSLRIGPYKIINKISDITYEIVNQDGYTSHVHRNHLVPYYPKEPIIFPFIQQYNPYSNDHDNDNNESIEPCNSFSDEEQSIENEDYPFTNSDKETDIPSTIDFQPESFNQYSSFPYQQMKQKINNTTQEINLIFMTTITILIPEDTPVTDTISAHNHEKIIDFSSAKRTQFHFLKNPAERKFELNNNKK